MTCSWPEGDCACWAEQQAKPEDYAGRVWMHCEEGLSATRASMARFMLFCLSENIEIGRVYAFKPGYPRGLVLASVRLRPDQFVAFETETGGKLKKPPRVHLNSSQ